MGIYDGGSYGGLLSMPDASQPPPPSDPTAAFGSGSGGAFGSGGIFGGNGTWGIDPQKLAAVMNRPDNGLMGLGAQFLQRGQPQMQPMQMLNLVGQRPQGPATGLLSPYVRMLLNAAGR